ncbi:MAG: alanine racemase [Pseudohongiellaceae bacterium]
MTKPTKRAWTIINLNALRKNLALVRALCPESRIIPVIKSNAYGHGMEQAARALKDTDTRIVTFAVATLEEALELKGLNLDVPILLLSGFVSAEELALCMENEIEPVIHSTYQVELLEEQWDLELSTNKRRLWLKHNSGMNRLGMTTESCLKAYAGFTSIPVLSLF